MLLWTHLYKRGHVLGVYDEEHHSSFHSYHHIFDVGGYLLACHPFMEVGFQTLHGPHSFAFKQILSFHKTSKRKKHSSVIAANNTLSRALLEETTVQ